MAKPYEPLPPGRYIRLLELHPGGSEATGDEFLGTFTTVSFDETVPRYMALSYTWDKPVVHTTTLQMSNGQSLPLSQTLTDFFRMLHRNRRPQNIAGGGGGSGSSSSSSDDDHSYLWIDALCIDQSNKTEKASQVAQMGRVYSAAAEVLVWLGRATPATRAAFAFMGSKAGLAWPHGWDALGPDGLAGLDAMLPLLARPWFRRAWVIQEVALNARVRLACGDDAVDIATFRVSVYAVWRFHGGQPQPQPQQQQGRLRGAKQQDEEGEEEKKEKEEKQEKEDLGVRGLWNATQVLEICDRYLRDGPVRYELLLQAAFYFEATDARDSVFAFRGIADAGRMPIPAPQYAVDLGQEPEYSDAVTDLYRRTAEAMLCHGPSLDLLALGGLGRPRAAGLPTWVPDYRHHAYVAPFMSCDAAGWRTGGELEVQPRLVAPGRLRVRVRPFDTVAAVCAPFDSSSVAGQQKAMADIEALGKDLSWFSRRRGSWRKDLGMHMIFGLGVNDLPAGPEYREYFREWKAWLDASTSDADLEAIQHNKFHLTLEPRIDDWAAFGTKKDRFCIGPPEVKVGDLLCVVPGCRMPLVLRAHPGDDDGQRPGTLQCYSLLAKRL